jgi:hypothetical protein
MFCSYALLSPQLEAQLYVLELQVGLESSVGANYKWRSKADCGTGTLLRNVDSNTKIKNAMTLKLCCESLAKRVVKHT